MTTTNSTAQILLEGSVKYRDSRKWKSRWAVVSKLSPVAAPRDVVLLESYLGIESGFTLERDCNTIAIIGKNATTVLAFETREIMQQWQMKMQSHFCKERHYLVSIISLPSQSKLTFGPARLLLQNFVFCLVSGVPPRLLGHWQLDQLRRFGSVENKFCFEGGSQCGKGIGLHVLYTNQSEELSKCFEQASCGQLNSVDVSPVTSVSSEGYYCKGGHGGMLSLTNNGNHNCCRHTQVHKSNSAENCDCCSQVLSFGDDISRSSYCLNSNSSQCGIHHSSINLSNHERLFRNGSTANEKNQGDTTIPPQCSATLRRDCLVKSIAFQNGTISRSSNVDLDRCAEEHSRRFSCLNNDSNSLSSLTVNRNAAHSCSRCTSSLGHCTTTSSDRESLFSQCSHGSSSTSSSASTSVTSATSLFQQPFLLERTNTLHFDLTRQFANQKYPLDNNNQTSETSADKQKELPFTEPEHLYSQINLTKRATNLVVTDSKTMETNYDIPKNLCLNLTQSRDNSQCFLNTLPHGVINHCLCDTITTQQGVIATVKGQVLKAVTANEGNKPIERHGADSLCTACSKQRCPCQQSRLLKQTFCLTDSQTEKLTVGSATARQPENWPTGTGSALEQANYANMDFIKSLALYENLNFLLANGNGCQCSNEKDSVPNQCTEPILKSSPSIALVDPFAASNCLYISTQTNYTSGAHYGQDGEPSDDSVTGNKQTEQHCLPTSSIECTNSEKSMMAQICDEESHSMNDGKDESTHESLASITEDGKIHLGTEYHKDAPHSANGNCFLHPVSNINVAVDVTTNVASLSANEPHCQPLCPEWNVSLSSPNNLFGCEQELSRTKDCSIATSQNQPTISNLINGCKKTTATQHRHCNLWMREKSYSINDMSRIESNFTTNSQSIDTWQYKLQCSFVSNNQCNSLRKAIHKSDEVLNVARKASLCWPMLRMR